MCRVLFLMNCSAFCWCRDFEQSNCWLFFVQFRHCNWGGVVKFFSNWILWLYAFIICQSLEILSIAKYLNDAREQNIFIWNVRLGKFGTVCAGFLHNLVEFCANKQIFSTRASFEFYSQFLQLVEALKCFQIPFHPVKTKYEIRNIEIISTKIRSIEDLTKIFS